MHAEETERLLNECAIARNKITTNTGVMVSRAEDPEKGLYLLNYANCLLSRQMDIYDDSILLIKNNRLQSACAISRGMIETYAVSRFLAKQVDKILAATDDSKDIDKVLDLVIKFTNSSRFKETEQKKLERGIFNIEDFYFTEETKMRFEKSLASSVHVMNALRDLFQDQMKHTQQKESSFEFIYDALSEWVHPSQTSVFHNYTPETHLIPTSLGPVNFFDSAKYFCANALHFITHSEDIYKWQKKLAAEITEKASKKNSP